MPKFIVHTLVRVECSGLCEACCGWSDSHDGETWEKTEVAPPEGWEKREIKRNVYEKTIFAEDIKNIVRFEKNYDWKYWAAYNSNNRICGYIDDTIVEET